jgi:hypothetical protein
MPSKSQKEELKELVLLTGAIGVCCPRLRILDDQSTLFLLTLLDVCRYTCPRLPVPKSTHWLENVLSSDDFDESRFRGQLRMSKAAFCQISLMLEGILRDKIIFILNITYYNQ